MACTTDRHQDRSPRTLVERLAVFGYSITPAIRVVRTGRGPSVVQVHGKRAIERDYARTLIRRTNGNVSAAARMEKMDRSYLIKLMRRHGVKPARETGGNNDD
jgi:transcriptional regulator with GAF, ATPase, and Fis domain